MGYSVRHIEQQFWQDDRLPQLMIRSTYNSQQSYKAHSHPQLSIGLIEQGVTCSIIDNQEQELHQQQAILIEPNRVHACTPLNGKPRSYHMLYIDNAWCCQQLSIHHGYEVNHFECNPKVISSADLPLSTLIAQISSDSCAVSDTVVNKINSELISIVVRFCQPLAGSYELLELNKENALLATKTKTRLIENIECTPSVNQLASEFDRSAEFIIRNFKHHFGITPKAFLQNYKVELAKQMLDQGIAIADVAADLGFTDQSQLHRAFVNYTASTPRQYQKSKLTPG